MQVNRKWDVIVQTVLTTRTKMSLQYLLREHH